ncbi:hypothetical protein [Hyphococcus sp. DH-69]|uniref:hypothetical protein n=1 Tax=Hyphococcus formosus TaxID=3143534 RepID=UPI00398AA9CE
MNTHHNAETTDLPWRKDAPKARRAAMELYSWREPGWVFMIAIAGALLFVGLAVLSPALLSLMPPVDLIAPIAEARAVMSGEAGLADHEAPLYLLLLIGADVFVDAPGRVHLIAKALGAVLIFYPLAFLSSSRFPAIFAAVLTIAYSAFVVSPFAGIEEIGLALLLVAALSFVSVSADESLSRARIEGAIGGSCLYGLWLVNPAFALVGFAVLSVCPFLTGRYGLWRYVSALAAFVILAIFFELIAFGINLERAALASSSISLPMLFGGSESGIGLGGAAYAAILVIFVSAIFGGHAHRKNWMAAFVILIAGLFAARVTGANAMPVFGLAAGLACFSVASPFYDGLFKAHDRASVSVALISAALALFWTFSIIIHSIGQFSLQHQVTAKAPENIRAELALVQPGGPTIAKWVEEGRFSTPEAREFFALTPVDQSAMLLEAASRARQLTAAGVDIAFLTGADTACVLAESRNCRADGTAAANAANVVFVPRLDMDPKTAAAKGKAEVLLYTQFKMIERTALWEIWVRRDAVVPAKLFKISDAGMYR